MDGLAMGARQHPKASVLEGRLGDCEPQAHLGRTVEGEVERVLVPRLPPGGRVLEDELGEEAVDPRPEQAAADVEDGRGLDELAERTVAVELEDLGDAALRVRVPIHRRGEVLLGRHDEAVVNDLSGGRAADLHDALEHRLADRPVGEAGDEKEALLLPVLPLGVADHPDGG
jgi:hypothetical protein